MKKSLLVLTAALSFGFAAAQDTAPAAAPAAQIPALTDVPAGHWAKDAIDRLVSQGIILGYPDGTFRGTQNLTRYEAAVIIARLLNQMGTAQAPVMDPETMTSLQNAIQELAADLAALGVRVSDLEENAVTKDDFSRLEQRVEELGTQMSSMPAPTDTTGMQGEVVPPAPFDNTANEATQADLQDQVSTVQDQVAGNSDAITDLQGQISDFTTRADDLSANYDTLRADVDDNASSIAALNDLTVLLNQDILNLQDRSSAIEAAQADFVQRADFDNLVGRVAVNETKITDITTRVTALEKNAFSIKPNLSATYFVARADRDMDIDRLFAGTKFSTGDDGDTGTSDTSVDYVDLAGDQNKVVNNANGLYGFSTDTYTYAVVLTNPTAKTTKTVTYTAARGTQPAYVISAADTALGFTQAGTPVEVGALGVNKEGRTSISFGITFNTTGTVNNGTSANTGAYLTSAGGVAIKNVDIKFGITANPELTGTNAAGVAAYPSTTDSNGYKYQPLFFYFKNGTATFTVGNSPVTVDFGGSLKFKFSDYVFDNDKNGRGDGYVVTVDGSNLPVLGAFKPVIKAVYGSSRLSFNADGSNNYAADGRNGDYQYYRGVRAEITPIGTLKLGLNYSQEALDTVGIKLGLGTGANVASDVKAYGADAHGALAGFQIDSEYARSVITGTDANSNAANFTNNVFYAKTSGSIGPIRIYDLNYRSVDAGYDKIASNSEADPKDGDNGSTAPYNRGNRAATDNNGVAQDPNPGQVGAAAQVGGSLGPVAVGGYYNVQTTQGGNLGSQDANGIADYGVAAKVNLLNLVTVRGGYYSLYTGTNSADISNSAKTDVVGTTTNEAATRYIARADLTPGFGFSVGGYYQDVSIGGSRAATDTVAYGTGANAGTASLFANSRYNSYYTLNSTTLTNQSGCGSQHPGTGLTDTDAVGGALTFSLGAFSDKVCYSEYGAEVMHDGALPGALVKNLSLRFGYAKRFSSSSSAYNDGLLYADGLYNAKLGFLNVNLKGLYNNFTYDNAAKADLSTVAAGAKVSTDTIDTIFKPSIEGQIGYLSRNYTGSNVAASNYDVSALSYRAGVKFNDFLLPTGKLAVYYAGLNTKNRSYTPWTNSTDNTAGSYGDTAGAYSINQNGLYVEGNYYDLSFAYGLYNLSAKDANGTQMALPSGQVAQGSTFKITYKVNF